MKLRTKIIIGVVGCVALTIYFKFFFQTGVRIDEDFLRVTREDNKTTYSGELLGSKTTFEIETISEGEKVIYYTSGKIKKREYRITYTGNEKTAYYQLTQNGVILQTPTSNNKQFGYIYAGGSDDYVRNRLNNQIVDLALNRYEEETKGRFAPMLFGILFLGVAIFGFISPQTLGWMIPRKSRIDELIDESEEERGIKFASFNVLAAACLFVMSLVG